MKPQIHDKKGLKVRVMVIFCFIYILELVFFSCAIFFNVHEVPVCVFVQFSCCLTFGNFFLLYGAFKKNSSNLSMYTIVYTYTMIINFLNSSTNHNLYLTFKICQVSITGLRGIIVFLYYQKFANKFISFDFRKYQSNEALMGKLIFLI